MLTEKGKTLVKWCIAGLLGYWIGGSIGLAIVALVALLKVAANN